MSDNALVAVLCDTVRLCRVYGVATQSDPAVEQRVDIVFDGPPAHESGRFIEVESPPGKSIKFGEWIQREDGYWVLRISREDFDSVTRSGEA